MSMGSDEFDSAFEGTREPIDWCKVTTLPTVADVTAELDRRMAELKAGRATVCRAGRVDELRVFRAWLVSRAGS